MIRNRIRVMSHLAYPRNNWQQWCSYVNFSQREDSSATGASCPDSNATCVHLFGLGVNPLECPAEARVGKKHVWKGKANILYGIKLGPIAVRAHQALLVLLGVELVGCGCNKNSFIQFWELVLEACIFNNFTNGFNTC